MSEQGQAVSPGNSFGFKDVSFRSLWHDHQFQRHIAAFVLCNAVLYMLLIGLHSLVPFHRFNYVRDAQHYVADSRLDRPDSFNLLDGLGQYDAQYYLKVAATGYHKLALPIVKYPDVQTKFDVLSYAFMPAYPLLVAGAHVIFGSIELSAFIISQILLLLGFCLVYWLVSRWITPQLAARTSWLVFLYPFSIFYRSYFSEGLFLVLLAILLDSLLSRRWVRGTLSASILVVTRFIGIMGAAVWLWQLLVERTRNRIRLPGIMLSAFVIALPLLVVAAICYHQTGNPVSFITVHARWYIPPPPVVATYQSIVHFSHLPWHAFHRSRLDVLSIVLFGILIIFSGRWLPRPWWYLSLLLWLFPILTIDTMSASRYQIVNLPAFIYATHLLSGWRYWLAITLCVIGLFVTSLYFVNWRWIG